MCRLEQHQVGLSSITVQSMQQQVILSKLQTNSVQILFSTHISAYDRLVNHSYRMLNVSYEPAVSTVPLSTLYQKLLVSIAKYLFPLKVRAI
jgi:hypothetical protein